TINASPAPVRFKKYISDSEECPLAKMTGRGLRYIQLSVAIFIVTSQPRGAFITFISSLGHQVKIVVGSVDHVYPTRICLIRVKDIRFRIFIKHAGAFPI